MRRFFQILLGVLGTLLGIGLLLLGIVGFYKAENISLGGDWL